MAEQTLEIQLQEAVAKYVESGNQIDKFTNGADSETVDTAQGPKPTLSKIVKDNLDTIAASRLELDNKVEQASQSASSAAQSSTEIQGIKDEVTLLKQEMATIFSNVGDSIGQYAFFAKDDIPNGWLRCDGSTINKSTYPDLVGYLNKGKADADTLDTATLPEGVRADGRGNFLRDIGQTGIPMTTQEDELKAHNHIQGIPFSDNLDTRAAEYGYIHTGYTTRSTQYGSPSQRNARPYTSTVGGEETRPVALLAVLCIKAFHGVVNTGSLDVASLAAEVQTNTAKLNITGEEVVLWDNGDVNGIFSSGATATLIDSMYNYKAIVLISGFTDPMTNRQTTAYLLPSQISDGLIVYGATAGNNYYELEINNNATTVTGRNYSGSNIRFKKVIGIK